MIRYMKLLILHTVALVYFIKTSAGVTSGCSDVCDFNDWARDASCRGRNLADIPQECRHAKTLQMQDNRVSMLSRGVFHNFTRLKYLYLERNNLSVQAGAFDGCSMLEKVQLSQNHVPTLEGGIFEGLSSVLFMFIDQTGLQSVRPGAFQELSQLTFLSLQRNKLTAPPCDAFSPGNNLETLYLTSNQISVLPDNCFSNYQGLIKLYLKNNPLREPNALAFQGLSQLQLLYLQNTNLNRVPTGIFQYATNIQRLYLSFNNIKYLFSRDFVGLSSLTHLYLQNNGLLTIHTQAFEFLSSIHTLDVSHNAIKSVGDGALSNFRELRDLRLQHNQLNSTKNISFSMISTEARIDLEDNPLHCDCAIYPFRDWLKRAEEARRGAVRGSSSHIKCSSPTSLSQISVSEVDISDICPESQYPSEIDSQQSQKRENTSDFEYETGTQRTSEFNGSPGLTDVQLTATITGGIAITILCVGFVALCVMYRRINSHDKTACYQEDTEVPRDIHRDVTNINRDDRDFNRDGGNIVRITRNPLDVLPTLPPRDGDGGTGNLSTEVFSRHSSPASSHQPRRNQSYGDIQDVIEYSTVLPDNRTTDSEQEVKGDEISLSDWLVRNRHRIQLSAHMDVLSASSPVTMFTAQLQLGPNKVGQSGLTDRQSGAILTNHAGYIPHDSCV